MREWHQLHEALDSYPEIMNGRQDSPVRVSEAFTDEECRHALCAAPNNRVPESPTRNHSFDVVFETLGQSNSLSPNTLAYCDSVHHLRRADRNPSVSVLITTSGLAARVECTPCVIIAERPRQRFFELHEWLCSVERLEPELEAGIGSDCHIHSTAVVSSRARLGDRVSIGAHAVIEAYSDIGSDTMIEAGAHVGAEGLLHRRDESGNNRFVRHQGGVRVGAHCAVLSRAVIVRSVHRGLLTSLGDFTIIGVASNIGHEAQLGVNVVVSNHCVIARGAELHDRSFVGTTSVVREYVTLGEQATVKAGSIVVDDVVASSVVSGNFATDHNGRIRRYLESRRQ